MTAQSAPRRSAFRGRVRVVALTAVLTAATFIVDAAPVRLPGPLGEALGPTPTLAGYCASNASFQGRLTASSGSTIAVARTTSPTVFGYISSVAAAWSCTAYFRYSGITWNTTATTGTFQWGNLINSDSVACNFVVGSTDYIKANSTADCPDSDAEYALSATLDAQRVYQRDAAHNSIGDLSFVQTDCATYYGQKPLKTGQTFATDNTGNRPSASNCDPIAIDDTGTAQTITYDATGPALGFDTPATGTTTYGSSTAFTVGFDATDAVAGFDATHTWTLTRKIATATNGSCGAYATDVAAGSVVTGTANAANQTSAQTLVGGKCYQWTLSGVDANGNAGTVATSGTRLVDSVAPTTDFTAPNESTTTTINATSTSVSWTETEAASGVLTRSLQRRIATNTGGVCGAYANDGTAVTTVSPVSVTGLLDAKCYQWIQTLTDRAGNATAKTSGTIKVELGSPSANFSTPNEGTTTPQNATSYSVAWTETAGSGTITSRSLQRKVGTIVTSGTCVGVTWTSDGAPYTGVSPRPENPPLVNGNCYQWVQTLTNSNGKTGQTTSGNVLIDTVAPAGTVAYPEEKRPVAGDVVITGSATDAGSFLNYQLEYGAGDDPGSWTTIVTATTQVNPTNSLGTWSTGSLNGAYTLRLTVRDSASNGPSVTTRLVYLENAERGEESYQTRIPFDLGGGYSLDVGVSNGEARLSRDLFEIPSFGPSQALSLSYSSLETGSAGRFGTGWTSNLTQYLTFESGFVVWHRADGGRVPFGNIGGTWTPLRGHFEVLATGTGTYTVTLKDQTKLTFEGSGAGRLTKIQNRFGKALTLAWNTSSATVTDATIPIGRETTLAIDSVNNRITGATDSAGRAWSFGYTGTDLASITDPASKVTTLAYDGSHHLTSVTRSRSRVSGAPETITWAIGYTAGKATSVTDPVNASVANTFTYNAGSTVVGLLKEYAGPVRNTTTYTYDSLGRVTSLLDPEGFTTSSSWDANPADADPTDSNLLNQTRPIDADTQATTTWTYDARGNVLTETAPISGSANVVTLMTYNATNDLLIRSEADNDGAVKLITKYAYDGAGHLTSVNVNCTTSGTTPPASAATCTGAGTQDSATNLITTYTYSANDQVETETDPLGRVTKHEYDEYGNETTRTENYVSGQSATADRNVATVSEYLQSTTAGMAGLATSTTDPVGVTTTYSYDALGRLLTEVLPGDSSIPALTRSTTYDELGNVLTSDESWTPLGGGATVHRTTTHVYDLASRETSATDLAGVVTTTSYDAAGNAIDTTVDGVLTHRVYDGLGRAVSDEVEGTGLTMHAFDAQGDEIATTGADGVDTERTFTSTGWLLTETVDPLGTPLPTVHAYDTLGRETTTTNPDDAVTTTAYDRPGRTQSVAVGGATTTYAHDRAGNQTCVTTPGTPAIVTTTVYDPLNRATVTIANDVASPTLPTEDVTTTTYYDKNGTTVAVRDPKGVTVRTIPNVRGLPAATIANCTDAGTTPTADPSECVGAGTPDQTTNVKTTTTYDGTGAATLSIAAVGTGEQATTETAYDAAGRAIAVKDPMGTISRTIYTADKVTKTVVNCTNQTTPGLPSGDWWECEPSSLNDGTWNLTTTYAYDASGNLVTETAPNGRVTTSDYDGGRLRRTIANDVASPSGPTDDVTTWYWYDAAGRQAAITSPTADGSTFSVTRFMYDDAGRLVREIRGCSNTGEGEALPADPAQCDGGGTADADSNVITDYAYDARGNRTKMVAPSPAAPTGTDVTTLVTTRYAYDTNDRLCRVVENSTQTDVEWAAVDPICSDPISGSATTSVSTRYTYDAAGNLASMIDPNGETTTYTYDEAGRMTALGDALGKTTAWTYDALGHQTGQTNRGDATPLTPTIGWTYDRAGRQLTRTVETAPARDSAAPDLPTGLSATAISGSQVDLAWTASTDDVGVTRYTIRRDGAVLIDVSGGSTSYTDRSTAAGTAYAYTVTASDAAGNASSASATANETTPSLGGTTYGADAFGRTIASGSGWGTADSGGSWSLSSNIAAGTDGTSGFYSPTSWASMLARLGPSNVTDQEVTFRVKVGTVPPAGSDYRLDAVGRYIDTNNYYRPGIRLNADGSITEFVSKTVAGTTTHLGTSTTSATTYTAGTWLWLKAQFTGTNPTTIRLRLWADGAAEPGTWDRTETDSTAGLQVPSAAGLRLLPSTGFTFPVTINVDDVAVTSPGGGGSRPVLELVVAAAASPATEDANLRTYLEGLGFTVTYIDHAATANVSGVAVVVISESCLSATVAAKYRDVTIPVLSLEAGHFAAMNLATAYGTDHTGQTQVAILDAADPLAAGKTGTVTVLASAASLPYATASTLGAGVRDYLSTPGNATQVKGFAYAPGTAMANGFTAPAARGYLPFKQAAWASGVINQAGKDLVAAWLDWATDPTAPTTPTGLTATADGPSAINLSWTASTDALGVAGYRITRGGVLIATVGSTSWTDTGLTAATNYGYTVAAIDAATNLSAQSGSSAATTGPASITTTSTYDDNGNRLTVTDGTLTITATYDRLNRPLTIDDEDPGSTPDTTYTYSLTSPSWTDPTGTYLVALDRFDRATSVDGPVTAAFTTTYRADGQPDVVAAPNGNTTTFAYDSLGRETGRATRGAGPVDRAVYGLTYNRAGNVLTEASDISGDPTNGDTTYAYDPLGRLASFTRAAVPTAYGWDEVPNRASVQVGAGSPVTTSYDAANRPVADSAGGIYASDDDGRLTARPGQRLGWDNLGRLTSVRPATGSATTATYAYDPLDRLRLVDYGAGVRVRFRYVGLTTSVAQTIDDATGSVLRHIGTGWTGERLLDWTGAGSDLRTYGTNAHHDVTWLGSSTGTVSATVRYDPFGVVTSTTGSSLPEFRFQGSWADSASGLSWVVTRWYAPSLGRFISEDSLLGQPTDPPTRHLYAYAEGEPIARWDPDGLKPQGPPSWSRHGALPVWRSWPIRNPTKARGRVELGIFIRSKWNDARLLFLTTARMEGDGRGWSAGSTDCWRARGCITIDFDRRKVIVRVNPTCGYYGPIFGCNNAFPIANGLPSTMRELDDDGNKRSFVRVEENSTSGKVRLDWDLTQSRLPVYRPNLTINGRLEVVPPIGLKSGWFRLRADQFPSNELYFFQGAKRTTLARLWEQDVDGMGRAGKAVFGPIIKVTGDPRNGSFA